MEKGKSATCAYGIAILEPLKENGNYLQSDKSREAEGG
jgi:hypothetical protein